MDGVLGSTLTCKYLSSEAFLRKGEDSRPPLKFEKSYCISSFTNMPLISTVSIPTDLESVTCAAKVFSNLVG